MNPCLKPLRFCCTWQSAQRNGTRACGSRACSVSKWLFFVSNTLHVDFRLLVYPHKYTCEAGYADLQKGAEQRMAHAFSILDDAAQEWSGPSDAPTIMDYYVVTMMRWCTLYPSKDQTWFDIGAYPTLYALAKSIETRPAVRAAIKQRG